MVTVIKKLALFLAALVLLALCLEVFARLVLRTPPRLLELDPTIGVRYQPDFSGNVFVEEAGREVFVRFNGDGFRDRAFTEEAADGVYRIAVLGDSFIAAIATDEEKTMVRLLERRLEAWRPQIEWEVMNFGVSSSSTGQELQLYREVVRRYRPHLVLCFFTVLNDLSDNSIRLSNAQRLYFDFDERGELELHGQLTARSDSRNWLNRHSTFYRWQKTALKRLRYRAMETAGVVKAGRWIFSTQRPEPEDVRHAWQVTDALLAVFASEVEMDGSNFALVVLPSPEQIYTEKWKQMIAMAGESGRWFDVDHPSRRLQEIATDAGFEVFDMTPAFREAAPSASIEMVDEWLYFDARGHFNNRGNAVAADAVADWLMSIK